MSKLPQTFKERLEYLEQQRKLKKKTKKKPLSRKQAEEILKEKHKAKKNLRGDNSEKSVFLVYDDKGKITGVSIDAVVRHLLEEYNFKTVFSTKSEIIYFYKEGLWENDGREKIKTITEKLLENFCKNQIVNEVLEKIKRKTAISAEEFNQTPEGLICLKNGCFNLRTGEFLKHSPECYFKTRIPITYQPDADCPTIKKFFCEVLYEEDVPVIQEWFGYNLYNRYFEKRAVIGVGAKDTGKTVMLNLLAAFIGERNKVNLSLQKIAYGKSFDLLNLKDKYSNIHDDLSAKDLSDDAGFKIATGGGYITGEQKFGDSIEFKSFAKLTFACNKIPPSKDQDDEAYWDRWIPILFDNRIEKNQQDRFLLHKLTTEAELSGCFNWALEGLQRLIRSKGFSYKKSSEQTKQIMQRNSHPLTAFAQDCLVNVDGNAIPKDLMFQIYRAWAKERNIARMTIEQLGRQLPLYADYITSGHSGKQRIWKNAEFRITNTSNTFQKTYREIIKQYNKSSKIYTYVFSESVSSVLPQEGQKSSKIPKVVRRVQL